MSIIFFTLELMLVMMNRQKVYGKLYIWVPGISQKIGYWQMEHPFSSYIVQIFFFWHIGWSFQVPEHIWYGQICKKSSNMQYAKSN